MSAKRALFTTPSRSTSKRRRITPQSRTVMRVPRALLPETKQFRSTGLIIPSTTDSAYHSIYAAMAQAVGGNQFVGSKFRMLRLRVMYDLSQLSLTEGLRISVVIPKNPSTTPSLSSAVDPWDTQQYTVLFDRLLGDDTSLVTGTFDVKGPITLEGDTSGVTCLRNNVYVFFYSAGNGAAIANRFEYAMWFTDN